MRVSKHPEQRRAELISAARELFDKNGIDKTRISDIVKKVGVAQGVFYYYFSSKEEMVDTVAQLVMGELKEKTDLLSGSTDMDFCQKLANYIEIYLDLLNQFLGDTQTNLHSMADGSEYRNSTAAKCELFMHDVLEQLVHKAASAGDLRVKYPVESAKIMLYGIRGLAEENLPSRDLIYEVAERGMGLPENSLTKHIPLKSSSAHLKAN